MICIESSARTGDTGFMYFCIHCYSGKESEAKRLIAKQLSELGIEDFDIWFPTREVKIRRNGVFHNAEKALFEGYLFMFWDGDNEIEFPFRQLQAIPGVVRFLTYSNGSRSLIGRDLDLVNWVHTNDGKIKESKVLITEGKRVHFIEGPLVGFDGSVVKIDKHHKKVTVRFEIGTQVTDVSFSAEFIEKNITIESFKN